MFSCPKLGKRVCPGSGGGVKKVPSGRSSGSFVIVLGVFGRPMGTSDRPRPRDRVQRAQAGYFRPHARFSVRAGGSGFGVEEISEQKLGRVFPLLSHLLFIIFSVSFHRALVTWHYRPTTICQHKKNNFLALSISCMTPLLFF